MGIGGGLGTYLGGYIADRMRDKDIRWYMYIGLVGGVLNLFPTLFMIFTENGYYAMAMVFFTSMFSAFYLGPTIAVTHSLVNAKMRAFASSILFFILNLIGLGFGPLTVGFLSDLFEPTHGDHSLGYAFLFALIAGVLSIIFFYLAGNHYVKELKEMEEANV